MKDVMFDLLSKELKLLDDSTEILRYILMKIAKRLESGKIM